jgi:YD repeat-containing protein
VTTAPGTVATTTARCSFDTNARTLTCDFSQASNLTACTVDFRWRDTYNSVEDFVNEPTIVGKFLLTSRVAEPAPTSTSCQGGAITGTTTYTYDSERRLTRSVAVNPTGQGSPTVTYAYTAWDSQGRPTTGTVSIAGGPAFPVSVGYDDGARTVTINAASASVTTITYDTDGNVVRFRGESSGFVTESVYNITSRAPICR